MPGADLNGEREPATEREDALDAEVMLRGIVLSDAVRLFLARQRTQQVIATGFMLDEDVVRALRDAADAMYAARLARLTEARQEATDG